MKKHWKRFLRAAAALVLAAGISFTTIPALAAEGEGQSVSISLEGVTHDVLTSFVDACLQAGYKVDLENEEELLHVTSLEDIPPAENNGYTIITVSVPAALDTANAPQLIDYELSPFIGRDYRYLEQAVPGFEEDFFSNEAANIGFSPDENGNVDEIFLYEGSGYKVFGCAVGMTMGQARDTLAAYGYSYNSVQEIGSEEFAVIFRNAADGSVVALEAPMDRVRYNSQGMEYYTLNWNDPSIYIIYSPHAEYYIY